MSRPPVHNQLSQVRTSRGVSAADLARRVGVSRQTIYAIEAGTYVPNTEVTLRLARELEVTVEELFSLDAEKPGAVKPLRAEWLSPSLAAQGQAVQLCRLNDRLIAVPANASPYFLPEADGVISKPSRNAHRADLVVFSPEDSYSKRIVLAGCDPAIGLFTRMVERLSGVEIVSAGASSRLALEWLKQGKIHIAGTHLKDSETGEFNLPILRREFPHGDFTAVTFARWEEGFVTAPGNPMGVSIAADLARRGLRIVNREEGSGSRALLDSLLRQANLPPAKLTGYDRLAGGHLAAAYAVASGDADCCIATRSAARTFGLDFVPLQEERYDFVMLSKTVELPAVQSFLDVLQRAALRRKLEVLAGYDTAQTGTLLT